MGLLDSGLSGIGQSVLTGGSQSISGLKGSLANAADAITKSALGDLAPSLSSIVPTQRKDTLSAMQARPDPLLNIYWYASMPSITAPGQSPLSLSWEYVEEASTPLVEIQQMTAFRAGTNYHFPGLVSLGTLGLKLYEDVNGHATNYMTAWQKLIYNPATSLYTPPSQSKKTIQIQVMDVAQLTVMTMEYTGCWPIQVGGLNFGSGTSDRIIIDATFSVDRVNVKFAKFSETLLPSIMSAVGSVFPPNLSSLSSLLS